MNDDKLSIRLHGKDVAIKPGMVVAMWGLTESPVLVSHVVWMDEFTRSDFVHFPAGLIIIGKAFWPEGQIHEFWARGSDITQVLQEGL